MSRINLAPDGTDWGFMWPRNEWSGSKKLQWISSLGEEVLPFQLGLSCWDSISSLCLYKAYLTTSAEGRPDNKFGRGMIS